MRNMIFIAQKELHAYFASPMAYVVIAAFLAITGFFFSLIVYMTREASLGAVFANIAVILLFVAPALTMRLLAEEERSGTIELLLTLPVRDWEVVVGKFLASLAVYAVMVGLTLYYPLLLLKLGNPDRGPIVSTYLGVLLLGGAFLSIGLFASALSRNQVVAALVGFGAMLILWLVDVAGNLFGPPVSDFVTYISMSGHYFDFLRGVIDTKDVVFYLSIVAASLFLSVQVLQLGRWR
jgi:ABC-2 type transport system permease protein